MSSLTGYIKNALGGRYGRRNVSVKHGRGTARGWVEASVMIGKPAGCYCAKGYGGCRVCFEARQAAHVEATNIAYAAQEKSGVRFAQYYSDGPEAEARDCFMLQVSFTRPEESLQE